MEYVEDSHLLALVISAEDKLGNGVQLFDAETSELRVLESSNSAYSNLSWRTDAPDLAVLRSKNDDAKEGPTEVVLAWTGLGGNEEMHVYDPTADPSFPEGMRTVPFRSPVVVARTAACSSSGSRNGRTRSFRAEGGRESRRGR